MHSGVIAFARLGRRGAARDSANGQALAARRTTIGLLTLARIATFVAVTLLAFLSPETHDGVLVVLAGLAAVEITASTVWLWRTASTGSALAINMTIALDIAVWLAACMASGGDQSYALLLYVVLPALGALAMTTSSLLVIVAAVIVARPFLGGDVSELAVFYLIGVWAVAVAIAASRGRRIFVRRLAGLDAVWSTLAGGAGPSEAVRERVADELRHTALEPVAAIRREVSANASPEIFASLVVRMRTTIARIRAIAYELYAPPGLHGGVEESLRQLAQRRSAAAEVTVRLVGELPATITKPLDALVRDALGLVAGARTQRIAITVDSTSGRAEVTVTAAPGTTLDAHRRELRRTALAARPGVADVEVGFPDDGDATVRARLYGVSAPDPDGRRIQGVSFRETRGYIATVRLGLIPVVLGVPLIVGGTESAYPWFAAVTCVYLTLSAWAFWRPRSDAWFYTAVAVDYALLAGCLMLAGDARPALLPAALLIPVVHSSVFPWTMAIPLTAVIAVLLPLTGPTPQPMFTIALVWAGCVAMLEAHARTSGSVRFFTAAQRRNQLLQGLLQTEDIERRRLAERLHDDVLQLLFVARQDLVEAGEGCPDSIARAAKTLEVVQEQLTQTVSDLDVDEGAPAVAGGLSQALASTAALRGGPPAVIDVDPRAAGVHDGLLVQFARELYANAVQHARANAVRLSVSCRPEIIVLDFTDDGVGFDYQRVDDALARGCLGLATVRDRTTWSGGTLELGASEQGGAHVRIRLPFTPTA